MDLFTPIVPPERFHPNFSQVMKPICAHAREILTQWATGFIDRDGNNKFVREFQTTFNSCFWELYLHAVLREIGCSVDFSFNAPDFVVRPLGDFIIEATVALNAQDALPEWTPFDLNLKPTDLREFNRQAMLRLLNGIKGKSDKYLNSYQKLPHVQGKPYVIAITPYDRPFFYLETYRPIEAVLYEFYVDEQPFDEPPENPFLPSERMRSVTKSPGVEIPLGMFNTKEYAHISAVIFNSCATFGKIRAMSDDPDPHMFINAFYFDIRSQQPYAYNGRKAGYRETIYDGLRVYHNPNASQPLQWDIFKEPGVYQGMVTDIEQFSWKHWCDQPTLIARNTIGMNIIQDNVD